ncbi:hypothetical protein BH11PLA2_BH11PLA2_32690 [soil metagenome]
MNEIVVHALGSQVGLKILNNPSPPRLTADEVHPHIEAKPAKVRTRKVVAA